MKKLLAVILLAALTASCGVINKKSLGLDKKTPQVANDRKEELVVPPNFNLRPVEPEVQIVK